MRPGWLQEVYDALPVSIRTSPGKVFYSGSPAFLKPSRFYILGLNPGGEPAFEASTVEESWEEFEKDTVWSEFSSQWMLYRNRRPVRLRDAGSAPLQRRVSHLLCSKMRLDPAKTPTSNIVFTRSSREKGLLDLTQLAEQCWMVHEKVICGLGVQAILCFGHTAARFARCKLNADKLSAHWCERNGRKWTSLAHRNSVGQHVITLTHPGVADWLSKCSDPTDWLVDYLRNYSLL